MHTPAHRTQIGLLLPTWQGALNEATPSTRNVLAIATSAEQLGFDSVWVSDHLFYEPYVDYRVLGLEFPDEYAGVKTGAWECWTLLAAIAAVTDSITIGTLVSNTGFRNPALLARMADTVDDLSDGRLILGLGAGDFATEHRAFGFAFERPVARFEEALAIISPLLRGECVSYAGAFYEAEDAQLIPKAPRTTLPLMIGTLAGGPRMTRLVAEYAEIWNCMLAFGDSTTTGFKRAWQPVLESCEKHQRDPATLRRHATIAVNMSGADYPIPHALPLSGDVASIAEQLSEYAALGVDFVSLIPHPWSLDSLAELHKVLALLRH